MRSRRRHQTKRPGHDESRGGDSVYRLSPPGLKDPFAVGCCGGFDQAEPPDQGRRTYRRKKPASMSLVSTLAESGLVGKGFEMGRAQHRPDGGR